jgi:hypothetical protein
MAPTHDRFARPSVAELTIELFAVRLRTGVALSLVLSQVMQRLGFMLQRADAVRSGRHDWIAIGRLSTEIDDRSKVENVNGDQTVTRNAQ